VVKARSAGKCSTFHGRRKYDVFHRLAVLQAEEEWVCNTTPHNSTSRPITMDVCRTPRLLCNLNYIQITIESTQHACLRLWRSAAV